MAGADAIVGSHDRKIGLIGMKLRCRAVDLSEAMFGDLPVMEGLDLTGLVESQPRTWSLMPGGLADGFRVELGMEGSPIDPTDDQIEYSLDGSTTEAVIESHPDLVDVLIPVYNGSTDPTTGKASWPATYAGGQTSQTDFALPGFDDFGDTALSRGQRESGEVKNPMHGADKWLVPGALWTRKFTARILPSSLIRSLGTITESPPGNPPEVYPGANWLKVRCQASYRGNIWVATETWQCSGPLRWVPEVYPSR